MVKAKTVKKKQWAKSSRWRAAIRKARPYHAMDLVEKDNPQVRFYRRLCRLQRNENPFKLSTHDFMERDYIRLQENIRKVYETPSPWLSLMNGGVMGSITVHP